MYLCTLIKLATYEKSVKNALVKRYGIAESRLTIQGMGATDELFDEIDFNRVATFTDTTK